LLSHLPNKAQLLLPKEIKIERDVLSSLQKKGILLLRHLRFTAGILARLGQEKVAIQGADNLAELEPLYIRPFAGVA